MSAVMWALKSWWPARGHFIYILFYNQVTLGLYLEMPLAIAFIPSRIIYTALQTQKAVTALFTSELLLRFGFAEQHTPDAAAGTKPMHY